MAWTVALFMMHWPHFLVAQPPKEKAPTAVRVQRAEMRGNVNRQLFIGTLTPIRTSTVGSAVEGRLEAMHVELGDLVSFDRSDDSQPIADELGGSVRSDDLATALIAKRHGGQRIATIDSAALQIQILAAEIEFSNRQRILEELKLTIPAEIESAIARNEQAKAELEFAKQNVDRQQAIVNRGGALSEREIAEVRSIYLSRQQAAKLNEVDLRRLQDTQEIRIKIAETAVASQANELGRLAEELDRHTVYAPFAGAVVAKMTEVGDWVAKGAPIAQIVEMDPIELTVQVPQADLASLQEAYDQAQASGEPISTKVLVDGIDRELHGVLTAIVPQADLRTRTFPVVIRLPNPQGRSGYALKPGMLARTSFVVGLERQAVLVSKDALILSSGTTSVFLAVPESNGDSYLAKSVRVSVGRSIGESVEILDGVAEGDLVVVQGSERLRPGEKVKLLNP
ncbi:MAG TPA: efflux RND transporter periplasmic adaptor subunit [Pirellulaceae bacterium]|nr:efflux RND transporter periplasmic adaptor subunit [Pirellulaceae bacterium]HMO93249.1 efflux RND transporter periplasmic adaptor subunit [Pirellulaceae bacterium]HMP69114.1 efflux RND transporter periplasmic adaptor subunit [Pirellulaceae bacterium]